MSVIFTQVVKSFGTSVKVSHPAASDIVPFLVLAVCLIAACVVAFQILYGYLCLSLIIEDDNSYTPHPMVSGFQENTLDYFQPCFQIFQSGLCL